MQLSGYGSQSVGPGTGTLGVTQIVLTSLDSVVDQVNICAELNDCDSGTNPARIHSSNRFDAEPPIRNVPNK